MYYLTLSTQKLLSYLIDLIYPPVCPLCNSYLSEKKPFCEECLSKFKKLLPPFCSICAIPFDSEESNTHICGGCLRKRPYFKSISAPFIYNEAISRAVHLFKYKGKRSISKSLGLLLAKFARRWWHWNRDNYLIMPVPLTPKKMRERGFNQSLILARYVAKEIGLPIDYLSLRKIKDTPPQSLLKKEEREKNVKNSFAVSNNSLKGKKVILIDDVATTGTTLNECTKVLKKSGVKEVLCLVLARTDPRQALS